MCKKYINSEKLPSEDRPSDSKCKIAKIFCVFKSTLVVTLVLHGPQIQNCKYMYNSIWKLEIKINILLYINLINSNIVVGGFLPVGNCDDFHLKKNRVFNYWTQQNMNQITL